MGKNSKKHKPEVVISHNKKLIFYFSHFLFLPTPTVVTLMILKRKDKAVKRSDTDGFWIKNQSIQRVLFVLPNIMPINYWVVIGRIRGRDNMFS
jgi:hypothetical protein